MRYWTVAGLTPLLGLLLSFAPAPKRVVVTLDQPPAEVVVGVPFRVGFSIYEAGETPWPGLAPLIVVTSRAAPDGLKIAARPDSAPGHYVATLILPAPGQWDWAIYPEGDLKQPPEVLHPLQVRDPAGEGVDPALTLAGLGLLLALAIVTTAARLMRPGLL